jgi:hypothetical protein
MVPDGIDDLLGNEPEVVGITSPTPEVYDLDSEADLVKLKNSSNDNGLGHPMKTKDEKEVVVDPRYYFATKRMGPNRKEIAYYPKTGEVTDTATKKVLMKLNPNMTKLHVYLQLRDYGIAKRSPQTLKGM